MGAPRLSQRRTTRIIAATSGCSAAQDRDRRGRCYGYILMQRRGEGCRLKVPRRLWDALGRDDKSGATDDAQVQPRQDSGERDDTATPEDTRGVAEAPEAQSEQEP